MAKTGNVGKDQLLRYSDLYHSAHRTPSSGGLELPTILPSTKMMDLDRVRLLLGRELLHIQGIQYDDSVLKVCTENQLADLAGNSFASTVCLAVFLAMLLGLRSRTDSESEQEDELSSLVGHLNRHALG